MQGMVVPSLEHTEVVMSYLRTGRHDQAMLCRIILIMIYIN